MTTTTTYRKQLRRAYDAACNAYADAFCEKHDLYKLGENAGTFWVCDQPGTVLFAGDLSMDMATITEDIDRDAPEGEFIRWYDYTSTPPSTTWTVAGNLSERSSWRRMATRSPSRASSPRRTK